MEEWKGKLENYNSILNLIPFGEKTSVSRALMFSGMLKQSPIPINPDLPIVISSCALDLSISSNKYTAKNNIRILERFTKTILDKETHTTFLLYEENKTLKYKEYTLYNEMNEDFGEIMKDYTEDKKFFKEGETLQEPHAFDSSGFYRFGKNITAMYGTGLDVLEDQITISEELIDELSIFKVSNVLIEIDPDNLTLKNIYGDKNEYKPFPLIGERVRGDNILLAMSKESSRHAFLISDSDMRKINTVDEKVIIQFKNARVVDISVRIGQPECSNEFLQLLKNEQDTYENTKIQLIEKHMYTGLQVDDELVSYYNKLKVICDAKWKNQEREYSPKTVLLNITVVGEKPVGLSQKLSGTYGNKGVTGRILSNKITSKPRERMPFTKDGRRIDIILNTLSSTNRNIVGQVYYIHMANVSYQLSKALKEMNISNEEKANIILDVVSIYAPKTRGVYEEAIEEYGVDEFINYLLYKDKIRFIVDPMSNGIGLDTCIRAKKYLASKDIYVGNVEVFSGFNKLFETEIGEMYLLFLKQSNESSSNSSIRSLGSFADKGDPSKTQVYKENRSRYPDTPIKLSELDFYLFLSKLGKERVSKFIGRSENQILESFRAITSSLGYMICTDDDDIYTSNNKEVDDDEIYTG